MAVSLEDCVQRGHYFCIVDEVDSILIDEARTPLIISGVPETAADTYYRFARIVRRLPAPSKADAEGQPRASDYEWTRSTRSPPTESGVEKVERALGIENLYDAGNGSWSTT